MYYVIDLDNVVAIGGEQYLIDFLLLPTWNTGMDSPLWNRLYVRIDPTVPEDIPPYCTQRRLVENGPVYYYHPCVPFDVMQSRCANWISWGDVRIRHESGLVGREETISLLRIKSGLDLQHLKQSTMTDLCLVIEGKFPSNSSLNWNQWLSFGNKEQQNRKGLPSSDDSDGDKTDSSTLQTKGKEKTAIKAIEYLPSAKLIKQEKNSSLDDIDPKINFQTQDIELTSSEFPLASTTKTKDSYNTENSDLGSVDVGVGVGAGTGVGVTTTFPTGDNNPTVSGEGSSKHHQSSNFNQATEFVDTSSTRSEVSQVETVDLPQQVSRFLTLMLQNSISTRIPIENESSHEQLTSSFTNKKESVQRDRERESESKRDKGLLRLPSSECTEEEDWNSIKKKRILDENRAARSKISSAENPYQSHSPWNQNAQDHSFISSRKKFNHPKTDNIKEELAFTRDFEFDGDWGEENNERLLMDRQERRFIIDQESVGLLDEDREYPTVDQIASSTRPTAKKLKHDLENRSPSRTKQLQERKLMVPNQYSGQQTARPYFGRNTAQRVHRYSSSQNATHPNFYREYEEESRNDKHANQFINSKTKPNSLLIVNQNRSISEDERESSNSTRGVNLVNRLERQFVDPFSNNEDWNVQDFKPQTNNNLYHPSRPYHVEDPSILIRNRFSDHFES